MHTSFCCGPYHSRGTRDGRARRKSMRRTGRGAQGRLPDGSRRVSLRSNAYMGPCGPAGPYHRYTFELYALDTNLEVPQGTPQQTAETRTAVVNAMDGHVLGKAVLVARFHR